ncbi:BatD family protein [Pseudoxanthomonas composti]|uniref:Protein BatD n=1 Tax=Pseudoxanthomonas composti TaxID=2137479 RepID=A0A4Q1JTM5_9GAMM|nr:BatD family protein [Pseudoxanthomonas composti]RXR04280.1 protein BatD [Pseudoxanthomonas composti]
MPASHRRFWRLRPRALMLLALVCTVADAHALTRAWLDRPQATVGEPVVLNVETDQRGAEPDFSALQGDFELGQTSSSQQMQMSNGSVSRRNLFAVTLSPTRAGALVIPALQVGGERTSPLSLAVRQAAAAVPGQSPAFIETEVDDATPYVQQSVGVTVRLFYPPMATGRLEQPAPQAGALQTVGEDTSYTREVGGRQYSVVERHYLLVPDRSGTLTLPPARFRGQDVRNWMNDLFGDGPRSLQASGTPQVLQVQPQPADAPQPWLPLRSLRMRYSAAPSSGRAGEAATFTIEAVAVGATAAQLPDLPVPSVPGAQVFPEPAETTERFVDGQPQLTVTRRFSLVPEGAGKLTVPRTALAWWNVGEGRAAEAVLPALTLQVAAGSGGFANRTLPAPVAEQPVTAPETAPSSATDAAIPSMAGLAAGGLWFWLALAFCLLWLLTLALLLARRRGAGATGAIAPAPAGRQGAYRPTRTQADLRRALDTGTLDEVAETLRGMAPTPLRDLDAVGAALVVPEQQQALDALRRARWADGDGTQARQRLRQAFSGGPQWRQPATVEAPALEPLYPHR